MVNPADESVIAHLHEATADDVDMAVDAAVAAIPGWAATPPRHRADVMRRLAEGLQKRSEELAATITLEMGAPIAFSRQAQVGFPVASTLAAIAAAERFEWRRGSRTRSSSASPSEWWAPSPRGTSRSSSW